MRLRPEASHGGLGIRVEGLRYIEAKPRGKVHRGNAEQPLTKSASSHDAKTRLVEGREALTNLVEGPRGVCEPSPLKVVHSSKKS